MTVAELIEELQKQPNQALVHLIDDELGHTYDVESVELVRDGSVEIY